MGLGLEGKAKAGSFFLPNSVTDLVDAGDELGTAVDKVFNRNNSKQGSGCVGAVLLFFSFFFPALDLLILLFICMSPAGCSIADFVHAAK